jgi:hypothetical protein
MNNSLAITLLGVVCIMAAGCFSAKTGADEALKKVAKADASIATNRIDQVARAATYIHGTGKALAAETNRTPAVMLAYDLNSRASTIIGPPSFQDTLAIEQVVAGQLSGIAENQKRSAEILARLDGQVVDLQKQMAKLGGKKADAEADRDEKLVDYAAEADFARKIKRWLWIGGLSVAGLFLAPIIFQVVSLAFPAFAPLTQIFSGIVALPFKLIMKVVPAAADAAGVVSKSAHQKVEAVALQTAAAIETMKVKNRAAYDTTLRPALLSATNDETQDTIRMLKKRVHPVKV